MEERIEYGEVRILHIGDVFLGSPFLSPIAEKSAERRKIQREIFERTVRMIRDQQIKLCLITGNLFDENCLSDETANLILRAFRAAAECRFVILPGPCDPAEEGTLYHSGRLPANVSVLPSDRFDTVTIPEIGVTVTGCGCKRDGETETFPPLSRSNDREIAILAGYRKEMPDNTEIISAGADYLALSGNPDPTPIEIGGSYAVYSGFLESRSFDYEGIGGANLITVTEEAGARRLHLKRLETGFCRCLSREIDVTAMKNDSELISAITEIVRINNLARNAVLRVVLTGTVQPGLCIPRNPKPGSFGLFAFALVNLTAPKSDPQLLRDMSARGELYRILEPKIKDGDSDAEKTAAARALTLGLAALEGQDIKEL